MPPSLLPVRWRPLRSAVWTYLPEIINSASSTTPMEKCAATTPGRSFSWSMRARMSSGRGTPLPLCRSRRHRCRRCFPCKVQSCALAYQLPPLPLFACVAPLILRTKLWRTRQRSVWMYPPPLSRRERRHMRGHATAVKLGQFSDFHALGSSRVNSH